MKAKKKKLVDDVITIEAVASPEEVNKALQEAKEAFAASMGMQPVPNKTVDEAAFEQMGIRDLDSIVAEAALQALIPRAIDKMNIIPAFPPEMLTHAPLKSNQEYKFTIDVVKRPEYEITSYEPVEITLPKFSIDEGAVDSEINAMLDSYKMYVADEDATDHALEPGDYCKIKITATEDGKEFKGLSTSGRTYAVGQGHMPKGFDDNVIGMKQGETKSFTFEAPSFDEDFNEKTSKVDTEVTILEVQKEITPELTDEWVASNMPMFKTAKEMRDNVRKSIEIRDREQYNAYVRQAVAAELSKRFEGKIADDIYRAMTEQLLNNIKVDVAQQGMSWEQFVEQNGGESQLNMLIMLQARDVLTQGFALDAVFRHFKLAVTDDDYNEVCHAMNPSVNPRELRKQIEEHGQNFALRESAERFKANNYVLKNAKITYEE